MDKNLQTLVISGLAFSGKSALIKWLKEKEACQFHKVVATDEVRTRLFGHKKLTWTEHMFKNSVAWNEIKIAHVVEKKSVLHEIAMLNREDYYDPMLSMIEDVNLYLARIAREANDTPVQTKLRVIHLHCNVATGNKRAERRRAEIALGGNITGTDITELKALKVGVEKLEFPSCFNPLYIDTSGESLEQIKLYKREILSYIDGDDGNTTGPEFERRLELAKESHRKLKQYVLS